MFTEMIKYKIFQKWAPLVACACLTMLLLFISSPELSAQIRPAKKFAIGIDAGTTGIGGELTTNLTKKLNVRFGISAFNRSESGVYDEDEPAIAYDGSLSINNISLLVDYYPFTRGLKLSAGFYKNAFEVTANAEPNESYEINGKVFSPDRLGSLQATVVYPNEIMPYIGIGFGNPLAKGLPIKLNMSLGLMYSGAPELTMVGEGFISPTIDQAVNFQDGLNEFEWFPVFKLGLSFRVIK